MTTYIVYAADNEPMELVGMYTATDPENGGFELGKRILGFTCVW